MGFTMFARCFLDIMYLVLLLFNDNLLILSHSLILDSSLSVSEIALVRLSETSDYLPGQVNTPLAVIRRTSGNLQQYFIFHYIIIL